MRSLTPEEATVRELGARRIRGWVLRGVVTAVVVAGVFLVGQRVYLGPDRAAGRRWVPSTSYLGFVPELHQVDGVLSAIQFHTNLEKDPHATVDLGDVYTVRRFRVQNRMDGLQSRAVPLSVEVSLNGDTWTEIARKNDTFQVWRVRVQPVPARFVRVVARGTTFLHLESIEVR